jgi:hypothetical protein
MGADEVLVYDDKWLMGTGYYKVNRWLFDAQSFIMDRPQVPIKHGFGWCSWKAFCILNTWERLEDGDIVLYLDGDSFPVAPFGKLFDLCAREGGVLVFEEKCSTLRFTKGECFLAMGIDPWDGPHACGRFSLWQKGSFLAKQMLAEWWAYSINPRCTLWGKSTVCADQPEYYRNSTEQSVLTCLAHKYNLTLHRGPDKWGEPTPDDQRDVEIYPGNLFEQRGTLLSRDDLSGSIYRNV